MGREDPSLVSSDIHTLLDSYSKIATTYSTNWRDVEVDQWVYKYTEVIHSLVSTAFNQLYMGTKWSYPKFC